MIRKNIQITLLSNEDSFADKLQNILDMHLTDPNFNTQNFCRLMQMSRSQLHRKIKANTGLSTSNFIHEQRIKVSLELLKNFKSNITQISKSVGYTDASYFTKKFKTIMGYSPSEYIRNI
jgi:AraC-like DNA-binding protein